LKNDTHHCHDDHYHKEKRKSICLRSEKALAKEHNQAMKNTNKQTQSRNKLTEKLINFEARS
jgi:hypothetical protein